MMCCCRGGGTQPLVRGMLLQQCYAPTRSARICIAGDNVQRGANAGTCTWRRNCNRKRKMQTQI